MDNDWGYGTYLGLQIVEHCDIAGCRQWVVIPDAAIAVLFAVLPVWWVLRRQQTAVKAEGLCPACGYDLRATPGRCPECGAAPASRA